MSNRETMIQAIEEAIEEQRPGCENIKWVVSWQAAGPEDDTFAVGTILSSKLGPAEAIGLFQTGAMSHGQMAIGGKP